MKKKITFLSIMFIAFILASVDANAQEKVEFEGDITGEQPLTLTGVLNKPKDEGPFPAVIMLCGCAGFEEEADMRHANTWVKRFLSWGYVTFQVDSFNPRKVKNVCSNPNMVGGMTRASDARAAKAYLSNLSFVDSDHIAVVGWSHGGWAVNYAVDDLNRPSDQKPFQAAIAIYPWCVGITKFETPLLILGGDKDDWFNANTCASIKRMLSESSQYEFKLKIYPNVYHCFDYEGMNEDYLGHHLEYNLAAAEDAIIEARDFLSKYLKYKE